MSGDYGWDIAEAHTTICINACTDLISTPSSRSRSPDSVLDEDQSSKCLYLDEMRSRHICFLDSAIDYIELFYFKPGNEEHEQPSSICGA
ncbi:hypothetical protein KP509_23G061600 [Ceratopteris richardii]|uniref:Uncharacterized protein n=1 Tax=Ceratopteris richardii TaxID=49495 RepID=A0A8T2S2D4_CERRI|nr:hypothetical protein KP509_23G061600 [Ceratopteris richardii]